MSRFVTGVVPQQAVNDSVTLTWRALLGRHYGRDAYLPDYNPVHVQKRFVGVMPAGATMRPSQHADPDARRKMTTQVAGLTSACVRLPLSDGKETVVGGQPIFWDPESEELVLDNFASALTQVGKVIEFVELLDPTVWVPKGVPVDQVGLTVGPMAHLVITLSCHLPGKGRLQHAREALVTAPVSPASTSDVSVSTVETDYDESESYESGSDESESDESGSDESGSDESGSDESGSDESISDVSGSDESISDVSDTDESDLPAADESVASGDNNFITGGLSETDSESEESGTVDDSDPAATLPTPASPEPSPTSFAPASPEPSPTSSAPASPKPSPTLPAPASPEPAPTLPAPASAEPATEPRPEIGVSTAQSNLSPLLELLTKGEITEPTKKRGSREQVIEDNKILFEDLKKKNSSRSDETMFAQKIKKLDTLYDQYSVEVSKEKDLYESILKGLEEVTSESIDKLRQDFNNYKITQLQLAQYARDSQSEVSAFENIIEQDKIFQEAVQTGIGYAKDKHYSGNMESKEGKAYLKASIYLDKLIQSREFVLGKLEYRLSLLQPATPSEQPERLETRLQEAIEKLEAPESESVEDDIPDATDDDVNEQLKSELEILESTNEQINLFLDEFKRVTAEEAALDELEALENVTDVDEDDEATAGTDNDIDEKLEAEVRSLKAANEEIKTFLQTSNQPQTQSVAAATSVATLLNNQIRGRSEFFRRPLQPTETQPQEDIIQKTRRKRKRVTDTAEDQQVRREAIQAKLQRENQRLKEQEQEKLKMNEKETHRQQKLALERQQDEARRRREEEQRQKDIALDRARQELISGRKVRLEKQFKLNAINRGQWNRLNLDKYKKNQKQKRSEEIVLLSYVLAIGGGKYDEIMYKENIVTKNGKLIGDLETETNDEKIDLCISKVLYNLYAFGSTIIAYGAFDDFFDYNENGVPSAGQDQSWAIRTRKFTSDFLPGQLTKWPLIEMEKMEERNQKIDSIVKTLNDEIALSKKTSALKARIKKAEVF